VPKAPIDLGTAREQMELEPVFIALDWNRLIDREKSTIEQNFVTIFDDDKGHFQNSWKYQYDSELFEAN